MEIYNVDLATARIPRRKRMLTFLAQFTELSLIYLAIEFFGEWIWPAHSGIGAWGFAAKAVYWALPVSLMFSSLSTRSYKIVVDDEEISTRNFKFMDRLFSQTVRRSEVRTIVEKRNGLLVSRYSRVGTFFRGGVWIPKQLADYEYLKRLVSSWRLTSLA